MDELVQCKFRRGTALAERYCRKWSRPGERWLDIGCGNGRFAATLSGMGLRVTGIDHDPLVIAEAHQRVLGRPTEGPLAFLRGNAKALPLASESVDGIVAVSFMGCLAAPRGFFEEARRVLRREGVAILTFTNRRSLLLQLNGFLLDAASRAGCGGDERRRYHCYDWNAVSAELAGVGFRLLEWHFYNFLLEVGPALLPPGRLAQSLECLGRYRASALFARNFILVMKKP